MASLPLHSGTSNDGQAADSFTDDREVRGLTLPAEVREYIRASLSENSRKAYRADLDQFFAWGGAIPASPEMVACYLADHAWRHAVATLARRLVSIGKAHTAQGLPSPVCTELVRATLRGIRHTHGSRQRQVAPAEREDVLLMVAGLGGIKGIRDRALLLIGFAGAFRRSELVSLTCTSQLLRDLETCKSLTGTAGHDELATISFCQAVLH